MAANEQDTSAAWRHDAGAGKDAQRNATDLKAGKEASSNAGAEETVNDKEDIKDEVCPDPHVSQADKQSARVEQLEQSSRRKDIPENDVSVEQLEQSSRRKTIPKKDVPAVFEQPPLQINDEALKHIASTCLSGNHGDCIEVVALATGGFHEIRELSFKDGWTCIARFPLNRKEASSVLESETATVKYVREHTTIPVPEIYFINLNPEHVVGAAFVLMEKLPGKHLYKYWDHLSTPHKLEVVEQLAGVVAQLCKLTFDSIGSLNSNGEMGPVQDLSYSPEENGRGPFNNTLEYFTSFLHPSQRRREEIMQLYPKIEELITNYLNDQGNNPILRAPYPLIHSDFDAQNMLFTQSDPTQPPQLAGIIDWDQSHSGPLYFLCEYPIFIQDLDMSETRHLYAENCTLRKAFVFYLSRHFPAGSPERLNVQECFRQKNQSLNSFRNIFIGARWRAELEYSVVSGYIRAHTAEANDYGDLLPYGGTGEWEPDSEFESPDEDSDSDSGDNDDEAGIDPLLGAGDGNASPINQTGQGATSEMANTNACSGA